MNSGRDSTRTQSRSISQVIKSWDEAEIRLEMIYFTGEVFDGEPTRVFGYIGRPRASAGKLPGILHIHGGGQTANLDWARFWARRGYVCLSFDFCGDTNFPELGPSYRREHFTKWGRVPANMMKVGGGLSMSPSPRHNPWFHWALAARRGLTLLETQADVQADKLGIFGISVGGTLTWTVAGTDRRVKAAVPIYGCGWEFYQYPPQLDAPMSEDLRLWRTLIAPESHASRITCPLLYLSASNDGHGRMDLSFWTLDRSPSPILRQAFSANYDHHLEPEEGRSLPLWMDCHLKGTTPAWPATPTIEILGGGVPRIKVVPANADDLQKIDLYYCLNHDWPTTRFWRSAVSVRREGNAFIGEAPCLSTDDVITAFANVTESTGGRHSSRLLTQSLAKLDGVRPTLQRESLVDSMETSTAWHWVPAYTDPVQDSRFFEPWEGPGGECGFTLDRHTFPRESSASFYFGTRKIGDPQFQAQGKLALLIDVFAPQIPTQTHHSRQLSPARYRRPGIHIGHRTSNRSGTVAHSPLDARSISQRRTPGTSQLGTCRGLHPPRRESRRTALPCFATCGGSECAKATAKEAMKGRSATKRGIGPPLRRSPWPTSTTRQSRRSYLPRTVQSTTKESSQRSSGAGTRARTTESMCIRAVVRGADSHL